jgi:hypothetical protein
VGLLTFTATLLVTLSLLGSLAMPQPIFQLQRSFVPEEPLRGQEATGKSGRMIGNAVTDAGEALGRISQIYQNDQEQLDRFNAQKALNTATSDAEIKLNDMSRNMPTDGRDFTKNFGEERQKIFTSAKAGIPTHLQGEFDAKFNSADMQFRNKAYLMEQAVRDKYYKTSVEDAVNKGLTQIDTQPGSFYTARKDVEDLITASGLPTDDKADYLRQWKANSAIAMFNTKVRDDPEGATLALGGKARIKDGAKLFIASSIKKRAEEIGLPPDMAVAVAYQESGLKLDVGNGVPGSTISGLFQNDRRSKDKFGYEPGLEGNIRAGLGDMAERFIQFKKDWGRNPNIVEYYIYHMQGMGGGKAILQANDNDSLYEVLARNFGAGHASQVMSGNPYLKGQSIGDYKEWVARKMNNALAVTGGKYDPNVDTADPIIQDIPYDKRQQLRVQAENNFNRQQAVAYEQDTRLQAKTEESVFKQGVDLYQSNGLTTDWVQQNQPNLSASQYKSMMSLALHEDGDKNKGSDFDTYYGLLRRADKQGESEAVIKEAAEAVANKNLSRADFDKIYTMAHKEDTEPVDKPYRAKWRTELEGHIHKELTGLQESFMSPQWKAQRDKTKLDFVEWAMRNSNATIEDMRKKADEFIAQTKDQRLQDARVQEVLRRIKVKTLQDVTPDVLDKFGIETLKQFKAGKLPKQDYDRLILGIGDVKSMTQVPNGK